MTCEAQDVTCYPPQRQVFCKAGHRQTMSVDRVNGIVKPAGKQTPGESAPRPATNENYLLISAFAAANHSPLVAISKRISDCGCNLAEARVASLGSDLSVLALAQGSWDAIAKLENALARLERDGESANRITIALTERFVAVMESEHRELGLGDPTLGKTVLRLVGSLARRTELWRSAIAGDREWLEATRESLYKDSPAADALRHSGEALKRLWTRIEQAPPEHLAQGQLQ